MQRKNKQLKNVRINDGDGVANNNSDSSNPSSHDDLHTSPYQVSPPKSESSGSKIQAVLRTSVSSETAQAYSEGTSLLLASPSNSGYEATSLHLEQMTSHPYPIDILSAPVPFIHPEAAAALITLESPLARHGNANARRSTQSSPHLTPNSSSNDFTEATKEELLRSKDVRRSALSSPQLTPNSSDNNLAGMQFRTGLSTKQAEADEDTPLLAAPPHSAPAATQQAVKARHSWRQYLLTFDWLIPPISLSGAVGTMINATLLLGNGKPSQIVDPAWWRKIGVAKAIGSVVLGVNSAAVNVPVNNTFLRNFKHRLSTFYQRSWYSNVLALFFGTFAAAAATIVVYEGVVAIPFILLVILFTSAAYAINQASRTFGFGKLTDYFYYQLIERPVSLIKQLKAPSPLFLHSQNVDKLTRLKPGYWSYINFYALVDAQETIVTKAGKKFESDDWSMIFANMSHRLHLLERQEGDKIFSPRVFSFRSSLISLIEHSTALIISMAAYVVFTNKTNRGIDVVLQKIKPLDKILGYKSRFALASIGGTASMFLYFIYVASHLQSLIESIQYVSNIPDSTQRRKETIFFITNYLMSFLSGAGMAFAAYNTLKPNIQDADGNYSNPYNLFPEAGDLVCLILAILMYLGSGLGVNAPGACLSKHRPKADHKPSSPQEILGYFKNSFFNLITLPEAVNQMHGDYIPNNQTLAQTASQPILTTKPDNALDNDKQALPFSIAQRSPSGFLSQGRSLTPSP